MMPANSLVFWEKQLFMISEWWYRNISETIAPEDTQSRIRAINARAAIPLMSVKTFVDRPSKLQAFSDSTPTIAIAALLDSLDPNSVIRIHSASGKGAAWFQTQPTASDSCFPSLELNVYLCLRLGIAPEDVNCPLCKQKADLSNLNLVNGCKNDDYVHRKYNVIMDEISKLCKATNLLVGTELSFCFNDRTNKWIDLVVKISNKDILVDANNPSNGFVKGLDVSSSDFPGAAAVIKARSKLRKYEAVIAASKDFVRFVIETQGR